MISARVVWIANLAAIELHPSLSLAKNIDCPTMMVFDLDPGPPANIVQCARWACGCGRSLSTSGLQSFPKTSGSKGLQIYVPLNTPTSYDATKPFAHALARLLEDQHRELVVSDMKKELRKGKVLVDWSQNDEHKTTIAVYSLRAREHPTVSTPVKWEEVEHMLKKKDAGLLVFEAGQVLKRVEKMGDLFEPVLTLKQKLPKLAEDVDAGAPPARRAKLAEHPRQRGLKSRPRPEAQKKTESGNEESSCRKKSGILPCATGKVENDIMPARMASRAHLWRNSMWELRDGLIPAGSRISIPPSFRRRIFCSTTPRNSIRWKSTSPSGN